MTNQTATFRARQFLKHFKIDRYFDAIIVSGEVGVRKPNAEIVSECQKAMGTDRVVVIGDKLTSDAKSANLAGVPNIFINLNASNPGPNIRTINA